MKTIADKLKELRISKKLSKEELSKNIKITITNIDNYENDKEKPSIEALIKYSKYFNVSMDFICNLKVKNEKDKDEEMAERISDSFEKHGIDMESLTKEDMSNIAKFAVFLMKNKFTDKEFRVVNSLMKIMKRYDYKKYQIEGLIEMLDILDIGTKAIFSNDRLYTILKDIQDLID
jgi:transcriptional regulator with XRE-family HTH domain